MKSKRFRLSGKHNAAVYTNKGCRCVICTLANRERCARARRARIAKRTVCEHREWRHHQTTVAWGKMLICRECGKTKTDMPGLWSYAKRKKALVLYDKWGDMRRLPICLSTWL